MCAIDMECSDAFTLARWKKFLMASWLSPNWERWHSSKMKTMRLSLSGASCSLNVVLPSFFCCLLRLLFSSSAKPSFWMVVTMTLSA